MHSHVDLYCQWRKFKYMTHGFREFCTYNLYEERTQWHTLADHANWAFFMWHNGFLYGIR